MAAISENEDQYIRLKKLVSLSTSALREKFDTIHPPDKLQKTLETCKPSITHRINRQECDRLYPPSGAPVTSEDMDLTALVRVLRNTVLVEPLSGFRYYPPHYGISFGADVVRIHMSRNILSHTDFGKLKEEECENMSRMLIEVIKRFCGSGFDDKIRHIKNSSLDYRAGRITWHAKEAMYLITNAFNERVLQPTKAPFIQLHQQQPIHYSILGSTILSYGKQTLSEIESVEELIYYLHEVQSITVRQSIFIITEYPYLKQKFAQLVSCQGKQSHSLFDITPAEFITDRNISIPENIFYLNSTLNSDEHGLYSQCGHVNRTSMLVPRSSTMDFSYTNEMCFDEHFYILQFCKYKSLVYDIQLEQGNSTNFSHFINIPGTNNSTTKIERCKSSGSCVINNFDATCKTEQELECPSSSQSSSDCTVSGWLHGHDNHSIRHTETEYESTFQNLITFSQTTTPCVHRNQTNNLVSTSSTNVIRSDLNENPNCTSREMENKTVTETKNGPSFGSCLFMYLCKLILYYILISILILCVLYINITVIYPKLCHLKVKITGCNFNRHYFFIFLLLIFYFL